MKYRWQELGVAFELESEDAPTIAGARRILSPGAPEPRRDADRTWIVEHDDARGQLVVRGFSADRSLIPVAARSAERALLHVEHDVVDYLMHHTSLPGVHGALLSREGRGVLVVGPSLSGKSTLAVSLWRAGWSLLSDDVSFIDAARGAAFPAPRRVSLRFGSRELVGDDLWQEVAELPSCTTTHKGLFFHPHELDGSQRIRETRLVAVCFLARRGSGAGPGEVKALNPAAAAVALVPYAFRVRDLPFASAVAAVSPMFERVTAFDLGRGDPAAMVRAVELQASQ